MPRGVRRRGAAVLLTKMSSHWLPLKTRPLASSTASESTLVSLCEMMCVVAGCCAAAALPAWGCCWASCCACCACCTEKARAMPLGDVPLAGSGDVEGMALEPQESEAPKSETLMRDGKASAPLAGGGLSVCAPAGRDAHCADPSGEAARARRCMLRTCCVCSSSSVGGAEGIEGETCGGRDAR